VPERPDQVPEQPDQLPERPDQMPGQLDQLPDPPDQVPGQPDQVPDPIDQQVLFALSQIEWDHTDAATWAVAFAELDDPARVGAALVALRDAAALNLSASSAQPRALQIAGATPHPASQRVQLQGRMPDGRRVGAAVAVFARGTRVFQATVVSHGRDADADADADATDNFFANLRFTS